MTHKYIAPYNKLYHAVVQGAVESIQQAFKREVTTEASCSPIRMVRSCNLFPLHILFNSYNDVLSKSILKELFKNSSLLTALKRLDWKHRGVLINKNLEHAKETLKDQQESLLLTLYSHAFLIKGGHILSENGSLHKTTCAYVKANHATTYAFDDKTRTIDGFYIFTGAPFCIVLIAQPLTKQQMKEQGALNPGVNISCIFDETNMEQFPLRSHLCAIRQWVERGYITEKTVSMSERFENGVTIAKMNKEL